MTDDELVALEQAAKAATPGPWERDGSLSIYGPHHQQSHHSNGRIFIANVSAGRNRDNTAFGNDGSSITGDGHADAAYIAAANPATILEMVADLKKARADACEWIDIARQLARTLGGGGIPEEDWIEGAREELNAEKEAVCIGKCTTPK